LDEERISLKEYNINRPATTRALYCGRPVFIFIEISLGEIELEEIALGKIMLEHALLSNIKIPD
jgi:hypothetical protein